MKPRLHVGDGPGPGPGVDDDTTVWVISDLILAGERDFHWRGGTLTAAKRAFLQRIFDLEESCDTSSTAH